MNENWYALYLSIIKDISAEESLGIMQCGLERRKRKYVIKNKITKPVITKIMKLAKAGFSLRKIALLLNVSEDKARYYYLKGRKGSTQLKKTRDLTEEEVKEMRRLKSSHTYRDLDIIFGTSPGTAAYIVNRFKGGGSIAG